MKVEIFCLCDFAQADTSGKMSLVGIFDAIYAHQVPATHNFFSIAAKIRFDQGEEGIKKIKISVIDLDGKPIIPAMEMLALVKIPPNQPCANIQVISLIPQITFPNFGEYLTCLEIDGRQAVSATIYVRQSLTIPPSPQTPLQGG